MHTYNQTLAALDHVLSCDLSEGVCAQAVADRIRLLAGLDPEDAPFTAFD